MAIKINNNTTNEMDHLVEDDYDLMNMINSVNQNTSMDTDLVAQSSPTTDSDISALDSATEEEPAPIVASEPESSELIQTEEELIQEPISAFDTEIDNLNATTTSVNTDTTVSPPTSNFDIKSTGILIIATQVVSLLCGVGIYYFL